MAFIEKNDGVVLSIKLTSRGRELLSKGKLTFSKYAIGDSEIDYDFISENNLTGSTLNILRPKDWNSNIISFLKQSSEDVAPNETIYPLESTIASFGTEVLTPSDEYGFFVSGSCVTAPAFNLDLDHVKQGGCHVNISEVNSGKTLTIYRDDAYNLIPLAIGDYIMVRWSNVLSTGTTTNVIDINKPLPILWYKVESITSGSLSGGTITIVVDRDLPNYYNTVSTIQCGCIVFPNNLNTNYTYSTDFLSEQVFSFIENYIEPTKRVPFWNMSVVFTNELAGVLTNDKKIGKFNTATYGGFVSYIQEQSKTYSALGLIHYTNASPANVYAEELAKTTTTAPTLHLPTIMWHLNKTQKMGLKLSQIGNVKQQPLTKLDYYDLADENNAIVGKVFIGLKMFVIENQDLLFAMSYKSNRNWTLPEHIASLNSSVSMGCTTCILNTLGNTPIIVTTDPTTIGGTGSATISNVIPSVMGGKILVSVINMATTATSYFGEMTGSTLTINSLPSGTFKITIYDLSSPGCEYSETIVIGTLSSILIIDNISVTY